MKPARYELTLSRRSRDKWETWRWINSVTFLAWVKAMVLKPLRMQSTKSFAAEKLELASGLRKR
jgi:hypothetical protein